MNRWMKVGMLAFGAALAGALALGTTAQAQSLTDGRGPGNGRGAGAGGPDTSLVAVAATTLGITRTELVAELDTGKTIAQVATAKGVAPAKIVDAFLAIRVAELKEAVAEGRITQEQADTMLASMRAHVTEQINTPFHPNGNGEGTGDGVCDGTGPHGRS